MIDLFAVSLVLIGTIIGAFGSLLLKKGSKRIRVTNKNLVFGFMLHLVAAVIYLIALKRESLSVLYPIVSLAYVWICLLSIYFLHERMSTWKWLGIATIVIGVSLIGIGA